MLKPDSIVLDHRTSISGPRFHWSDLISFAEVKPKADARWQACAYAHHIPEARPDLLGMLFLTITQQKFRIYWMDASVIISSPTYNWDDTHSLGVLYNYVFTLHRPLRGLPQSHASNQKASPFVPKNPRWRFASEMGSQLSCPNAEEFRIIFAAPGPGRQSCVLAGQGSIPRIIKSAHRYIGKQFKEEDLLSLVHADGFVPGVVRLETTIFPPELTVLP